jgi:hypothetical protein
VVVKLRYNRRTCINDAHRQTETDIEPESSPTSSPWYGCNRGSVTDVAAARVAERVGVVTNRRQPHVVLEMAGFELLQQIAR